jgi:FkbM family methyltransferase
MASRVRFLTDMGCQEVMTFLPVAWQLASELLPYYGADLPSVILSSASDIKKAAEVWSDSESRDNFSAQLLWRLRGDFAALKPSNPEQYFPSDLIKLRPDELVVDCGAFDGDTLRSMGSNFAKAWAIEPDPANVSRLRSKGDPRVTVIECALGDTASNGRFSSDQGVASALTASGGIEVRIETLDRLLEGQRPTFIKLDIEGAEQAALRGGCKLLTRTGAIVAVCVYHRPDDLWMIPLFLRNTLPGHRLFLRSHQNDGFEVVAYAVPPGRLP